MSILLCRPLMWQMTRTRTFDGAIDNSGCLGGVSCVQALLCALYQALVFAEMIISKDELLAWYCVRSTSTCCNWKLMSIDVLHLHLLVINEQWLLKLRQPPPFPFSFSSFISLSRIAALCCRLPPSFGPF